MSDYEKLSILNVDEGGAIAQVDYQLQQAIKNCADINTDDKHKRKVTLTVTIVPNRDRDGATVTYQVVAKLAPPSAGEDRVYIGQDADGPVGSIHTRHQGTLAYDEDAQPTPTPTVRVVGKPH